MTNKEYDEGKLIKVGVAGWILWFVFLLAVIFACGAGLLFLAMKALATL